MRAFVLPLILSGVLGLPQQQDFTVPPELLAEIFEIPSSSSSPNVDTSATTATPSLSDFTVRPTDGSTMFTDPNGDACKCVPYYLCDLNDVAVDANNATVTGWGELDIRFGEEECQQSIEKCCKNPKKPEEVPIPEPDASRLKGCGYRNPKGLDFTITGGTGLEAEFGEFPWVVALLNAIDGTYEKVGVLIHPQVVMTAAHVIQKKYQNKPLALKIRAGEWDTQTNRERLRHQERGVQEIVVYPGFNPKSLVNDMALLRLSEPLQLADHINVICLPDQNEDLDSSKQCIANGWGKDVFGKKGRYAVILKKVELDMVKHDTCNELLRHTRLGQYFRLHKTLVCAGGEDGKDTCQGDGGAPLVCPIGNDRYKLSGLVAYGIGCGEKNIPAVYVGVPQFRNWVDEQMAIWGYDTSGYRV